MRGRRRRRLDREQAERRGELLGILRRELPLGLRGERRRAEPEEEVAPLVEPLAQPAAPPPSRAGTRRGGVRAPRRPPRARARRARRPPRGRAGAPSARAAPRSGRETRRRRRGRARPSRRGARRTRSTMSARSMSRSSSSSRRTSESRRSNGPSNASRSSSSSRTATGMRARLAALPDAALRDRHLRALRHGPARLGRPLAVGAEELAPHEVRGAEHEDDDRHPRVQAQAGDVVRGIDAQQLLEEAPEGVVGDVEREQSGRPDLEALADPDQQQRTRARPRSARRGTSGGRSRCSGTAAAGARDRSSGPTAASSACRTAPGSTSCRCGRCPARAASPARSRP